MLIRIAIAALLLGILATLFSSAWMLFRKDKQATSGMKLLGVRVALAVALMALVIWGAWSGELSIAAPWSRH